MLRVFPVGFKLAGTSAPPLSKRPARPEKLAKKVRSATSDWRVLISKNEQKKSKAALEKENALARIDQFLHSSATRLSPDTFNHVEVLGSGSAETEVTHEINRLTGEHVAIKKLVKNDFTLKTIQLESFLHEVMALHRLRKSCREKNPYMFCMLGFFEDDESFYLVTEYSPDLIPMWRYVDADVQAWVHLSLKIRAKIITNLVNGLKRIHRRGVAHNDIALRNILFNPLTGDIRYIDFGEACYECPNRDAQDLRLLVYRTLVRRDEEVKASQDGKHPLAKALKLLKSTLQ